MNRLILDAAEARGEPVTVVSLQDHGASPAPHWSGHGFHGSGGSRLRFLASALGVRDPGRALVLATHAGLAPVARAAAIVRRAPLLLFLHGVEAWGQQGVLDRWGIAGSRALVTNSRFTLEEFRRSHPRFATLPGEVCHLPARPLGGVDSRGTPAPRPPRAIVVGRLWGRGLLKGQAQLLDAWPGVVRRIPGAELWIVGEGDGRAGLEERARALGLGSSVRFLGFVSDAALDAAYRSCDVYAMPSRGEGFGLVFAEAMARGLPCIASRFDAGSEVVVDGETGIHVDPDDPAEILGSLLRLLGDREAARSMGEAGRRRAGEHFTVERFRSRLGEILAKYGGGEP
ncbi:MAG: glycosyltransferase family 4 protein [Planctomycetaceae bacterium]|nr:glycosyltransferase family 4 protein [Planctomycetaceae bacterium]